MMDSKVSLPVSHSCFLFVKRKVIMSSVVSIVIPANNEEESIKSSIDSVLKSTDSDDVEIVVACNGCTDRTKEVAESTGVRVVSSQKSGMGFGKNLGGRVAIGDIVLFLDADTRLMPGVIDAINNDFKRNPSIEAVGSMVAVLDNATVFERIVFFIVNYVQYFRKLPTPSGAIFISKSLYDKIGGFDENIPQGTSSELVMKALASGARWSFLWDAKAVTSPRRLRKVGLMRQLFSWMKNVKLLRENKIKELTNRNYEEIR